MTGTRIKVTEDKRRPDARHGRKRRPCRRRSAERPSIPARSAAATPRSSSIGPGASRTRTRAKKPRCGPEVALADAVIALVSTMAIRDPKEKEQIDFDKNWFDLTKDDTPEGVKPDLNRDEYKPSSVSKSSSSA